MSNYIKERNEENPGETIMIGTQYKDAFFNIDQYLVSINFDLKKREVKKLESIFNFNRIIQEQHTLWVVLKGRNGIVEQISYIRWERN